LSRSASRYEPITNTPADGMGIRSPLLTLIAVATAAAGCGDEEPGWTVRQAESVDSVRGLPVRVRECRGRGEPSRDGAARRYERLRCLAGARVEGERFDTVAVRYEIWPKNGSEYELRRVEFIGGPGIP
jgi:hypothetical protein